MFCPFGGNGSGSDENVNERCCTDRKKKVVDAKTESALLATILCAD